MSINNSTRFIAIKTGSYPVYLQDIRRQNPNISFGSGADEAFFKAMGYGVVHLTQRPEGDVVEETNPVLKDGKYSQNWEARSFNEQELGAQLLQTKETMLTAVDNLLKQKFEIGMAEDFDGTTLHVQMRDADRVNIIGLRIAAESAIAAGQSDQLFELRTWENINVSLPAEDFVALTWKYMAAYSAAMKASWELKDAIKVAETAEELPVLPEVL